MPRKHSWILGALLFGLAAPASAEEAAAPDLWAAAQSTRPVPGSDRELSGEHAPGDLLAESARTYTRTGRLAEDYEAPVGLSAPLRLPVDTPLIPLSFVTVAVDPPPGSPRPPRAPQAAPGTTHWCALKETGGSVCFFIDADGAVYANPFSMSGAPSSRALIGTPISVPAPQIAVQEGGLPPIVSQIFLEDVNAQGYVLRRVIQENGQSYSRSYPRSAWGEWEYTWIAPLQKLRATPVLDANGAVRAANVTFKEDQ